MEKAPIDTSDVEEKAEEIIAEAEPPSEVYLYWVFFRNKKIHNTFGIIRALWQVYILKFVFWNTTLLEKIFQIQDKIVMSHIKSMV